MSDEVRDAIIHEMRAKLSLTEGQAADVADCIIRDAGLSITKLPDDPKATQAELETVARNWGPNRPKPELGKEPVADSVCPRCGGQLDCTDHRLEDEGVGYNYTCNAMDDRGVGTCDFSMWEWHTFTLDSLASDDYSNVVQFDPPHSDSGVKEGS
jgi:hypothetical protein